MEICKKVPRPNSTQYWEVLFQLSLCVSYKLNVQLGRTLINATTKCAATRWRVFARNVTLYSNLMVPGIRASAFTRRKNKVLQMLKVNVQTSPFNFQLHKYFSIKRSPLSSAFICNFNSHESCSYLCYFNCSSKILLKNVDYYYFFQQLLQLKRNILVHI